MIRFYKKGKLSEHGFTPLHPKGFCVFIKKYLKYIKNKSFLFSSEDVTGFTLVELVVIIGIIGFMSSVMLSGQRSGEDQRKLNIDSQKLVQNIRKAQTYAMSAKKSDCAGNPTTPYGISLNSGSPANYLLAADCNNNKIYDAGTDILVSTIPLADSRINSVSPSSGGFLEIFFVPPIPKTYINTLTAESTNGTITLCGLRRMSLCKSIIINMRGTVSTQ